MRLWKPNNYNSSCKANPCYSDIERNNTGSNNSPMSKKKHNSLLNSEGMGLSWICFTLTEFRIYGFAAVCSICSLTGLVTTPSVRKSARTTDKAAALCGFVRHSIQNKQTIPYGIVCLFRGDGIRTHGGIAPTQPFQDCTLNHSDTPLWFFTCFLHILVYHKKKLW